MYVCVYVCVCENEYHVLPDGGDIGTAQAREHVPIRQHTGRDGGACGKVCARDAIFTITEHHSCFTSVPLTLTYYYYPIPIEYSHRHHACQSPMCAY